LFVPSKPVFHAVQLINQSYLPDARQNRYQDQTQRSCTVTAFLLGIVTDSALMTWGERSYPTDRVAYRDVIRDGQMFVPVSRAKRGLRRDYQVLPLFIKYLTPPCLIFLDLYNPSFKLHFPSYRIMKTKANITA
jgi:hypothetical protein